MHNYLLFGRLSIIDFDARSNQPMQHGDASIVFNGELYNYVERRADLERAGLSLRTRSDTEVLLMAIRHEGWDVLDRCEGMWAFALYDGAAATLALCRDRFGEKPLYMLRDADGVYYGSEIKFIAALSGRRMQVNDDRTAGDDRFLIPRQFDATQRKFRYDVNPTAGKATPSVNFPLSQFQMQFGLRYNF